MTPDNLTTDPEKKFDWRCSPGHRFSVNLRSRVAENGCPTCANPLSDVRLENLPPSQLERGVLGQSSTSMANLASMAIAQRECRATRIAENAIMSVRNSTPITEPRKAQRAARRTVPDPMPISFFGPHLQKCPHL
ncbi:hypothetical protein CDO87_13675 [Sagittula sp. P11]|uniref:zinc-ribbon domain-containing protein n=1 Tax=Sagittula sp. P11 TaxID=2009329 RepID=UPI000C2D40E3|nr:hypothetical protein CDO87_13675 [Sagittula sp. P11]